VSAIEGSSSTIKIIMPSSNKYGTSHSLQTVFKAVRNYGSQFKQER
jgi:hypothetical protein